MGGWVGAWARGCVGGCVVVWAVVLAALAGIATVAAVAIRWHRRQVLPLRAIASPLARPHGRAGSNRVGPANTALLVVTVVGTSATLCWCARIAWAFMYLHAESCGCVYAVSVAVVVLASSTPVRSWGDVCWRYSCNCYWCFGTHCDTCTDCGWCPAGTDSPDRVNCRPCTCFMYRTNSFVHSCLKLSSDTRKPEHGCRMLLLRCECRPERLCFSQRWEQLCAG